MPLSPSPMTPGTSPFPEPGRRPPDGKALRTAALLTLPALIITLLAGPFGLPALWSVVAKFSNPIVYVPTNGGSSFQGFNYDWSGQMSGGGYSTPASLRNMETQVNWFHMNAVIIPVIADQPSRDYPNLLWTSGSTANIPNEATFTDHDTLPQSDYEQAIKDARKAGLIPILELQVRQYSSENHSSDYVGDIWYGQTSTNGGFAFGDVVPIERQFFDNYTAFATYYAALSQKYHLPYFIVGDGLESISTDNAFTTAKADPGGIVSGIPGEDTSVCVGRRDCEWRHVIHAVNSNVYVDLSNPKSTAHAGASYSGKLIYAANWGDSFADLQRPPEFENITWWDAVNYIGINAYFPLSQVAADQSVSQLEQEWQGQTTCLNKNLDACPGNIVQRIGTVANKYSKPVIFTGAGYDSIAGADNLPPTGNNYTGTNNGEDDQEQLRDMQALQDTFSQEAWWAGVFWDGDQPVFPRSQQQNWTTSSNWAGDTLASSKAAGQWLNQFYKSSPIHCSC